jgi:hypothetical protein
MLRITVPVAEQWDEAKQEFVYSKGGTLQLEHSLVSISKWESKWCKPFITKAEKNLDETIDYIRCMTLTQNVDPDIYQSITSGNIDQVNRYIEAPMTASSVTDDEPGKKSGEQVTSELIYYWMVAYAIPFECQKWHLNRLLMLIKICNAKNKKPKKRSRREIMSRNAALNAARRKKLNTKG